MPQQNSQNDVFEKYKRIQIYEDKFNNMEMEVYKLASVWLLAALGAIGIIIGKGIVDKNFDSIALISVIALLGTLGLIVLWILSQMVYHKLLNAAFMYGLRLEYKHPEKVPPIRSLMMIFSQKTGMAIYQKWYFLGPMYALALIGVAAAVLSIFKGAEIWWQVSVTCSFVNLLSTVIVHFLCSKNEKYGDIAASIWGDEACNARGERGNADEEFVQYLKHSEYEKTIARH